MKYKGNKNYKIASLCKLIRALKLSKSFSIQKIIKKLKNNESLETEQSEKLESRLKKIRAVSNPSLKVLAMLIITHYLDINLSSHFDEIESKVRLNKVF